VTPPLKLCRLLVAGFATDNPILFQSGSARMTDESMASLGELATDLEGCPDTAVYIEGHTDADGADELNLALSVARAEAVVDALVELGVGYQRLYAVGYGESLPIADNETSAGKRANRRIVFTILEGEQ
jgi:outer membrane protein OmpA-like peptidoglycan-associated protein